MWGLVVRSRRKRNCDWCVLYGGRIYFQLKKRNKFKIVKNIFLLYDPKIPKLLILGKLKMQN